MPNLSAESAFESLKVRVAEAFKAQFPFEGKKHRLECVNVTFDEKAQTSDDPHHIDNIEAQFKARTEGGTWGVPVRARLRLVDRATGHALEEATVTLARLPKLTRRYSYIVDGNERQHDSVFRLKSRPYHLIAANGDLMGRWNLARGHGFDIDYDPKKGKMSMGVGDANIPLYAVLRALGVADSAIDGAWGKEVADENRRKARYEADVDKLFSALHLKLDDHSHGAFSDRVARLRRYFSEETEVHADQMKNALGRADTTVTGENLLASSARLIAIQHGRSKENPSAAESPDDRQSLAAKYLTTTEDFVVEAIHHSAKEIQRKVADKIDKDGVSINDILSPNTYNKVVLSKFAGAQRPDQTNPLQFLSGYTRTTIRGKDFGGVGGERINLDPDKQINPTHLGFLDVVQSPESESTGIALNLPLGVDVSRAPAIAGSQSKYSTGQEIRTQAYDTKSRALRWITPAEMEHEIVAYPDQVTWRDGHPTPVAQDVTCYDEERKTSKRPWAKVRYVLPSSKALFSYSANLIPFLGNTSGNRAMMAAKQQEQALSLAYRETPLVQVKTDGAHTFERLLGVFASHASPVAGTVAKIEPGAIHVDTGKGVERVQVYNHYPLNGGKGMLHATPVVKVGDRVEKDQLIADTNYSKNGVYTAGVNLRVAYLPYRGRSFEDSIVISESCAKKMASLQMVQEQVVVYPGMTGGEEGDKARWVNSSAVPPARRDAAIVSKLDDRGIVREGSVVHEGDVLAAILSPMQRSENTNKILARVGKGLPQTTRDASLTWDHDYPGKVVKVIVTSGLGRKTVTVHVESTPPLTVGDKLTGRVGNKGIVGTILPDHLMPYTGTPDHRVPAEILLSPAGVVSRMNIGQVLETAASKIAEKTGKPYVVENFQPGVDYTEKLQKELKAHGLTDTEEMFDPTTGKSLGQIFVGKQYIHQLHHTVEKKMTARSFGGYKSTGDAVSGAGIPGGGQKMDMLTTYALLAYGSRANLREAQSFKSDGSERADGISPDAVWGAVMNGRPLPPPEPSRGMKNFLDYLRAMGVNTTKRGDEYHITPMTDAHLVGDKARGIVGISNGEIRLPAKTNVARGVRTVEEHGGLFDPRVTGGQTGNFWAHVKLAERMPNPLFESAIQSLTGTTKKQYDAVVGAKLTDGKSGFHVLVDKLKSIDVPKMLADERERLPKRKRADLAASVKRIRYLEALQKTGFSPYEAYTNQFLPVLPPSVRKIAIGLDGKIVSDDRNPLYLQVGYANDELKAADRSKPHEDVQKMRAELYQKIRDLKIEGATQTAGKRRHLTGLMEHLTGKVDGEGAPKESIVQDGVLSRRQDLSGRSTIIPEPSLHLDEVGIPVPIAMEMYRPFVVRELVRNGRAASAANKMVQEHKDDPAVMSALEAAVAKRPVMFKRDPSLHKFSIMGFQPRLVSGKAIQVHPLVCAGFGADFDGDGMSLYTPISDEAVEEVRKMFPSKNIFSPTHYGLMNVPSQDSLLGLYQATKWGDDAHPRAVKNAAEAIQLAHDGKLRPTDVVVLDGKKTTPGRLELAQHLPAGTAHADALLHDPAFRLDSNRLKEVLSDVGHQHAQSFARVVDKWKDVGNELSYLNGSSFSLHDFHDGKAFRDELLAPYRAQEHAVRKSVGTSNQKDRAVVAIYKDATRALEAAGKARYNGGHNRVWEWAQAGARGKWDQFGQLVAGPMLVQDFKRRDIPVPLTHSYGEGMPISEYWASMHGARKGTLDRVQGTREPGALSKDIMNTMMPVSVTAEDCGTTEGAVLNIKDPDVLDRYLAQPVKVGQDEIPVHSRVTPALVARLANAGVHTVVARSPLHCRMQRGVCSVCFGHREDGKLHAVGTDIGVIAGQALGEPVTQLVLRAFHSGGTAGAGGGVVDAFARVKQLFELPEKLPDSATLADVSGEITHVAPDARGGHTVTIGEREHRVVTGQLLGNVRVGSTVQRGDSLSTGPVNPHELLHATKSIARVRDYLTSELMHKDLYGGLGVRRRNVETVVKAMTNLAEITDAPRDTEYLRGQLAPMAELEGHNAEAEANGHETVKFTPVLRAMEQIPLAGQTDWLARLNYQRLKDTYVEGAQQGWKSNVHSGHPIPGLAHGAEFGLRPPTALAPPPVKPPHHKSGA